MWTLLVELLINFPPIWPNPLQVGPVYLTCRVLTRPLDGHMTPGEHLTISNGQIITSGRTFSLKKR